MYIVSDRLQRQSHRASLDCGTVTYLHACIIRWFSLPSAVADIRAASWCYSQLHWNCIDRSWGHLRYYLHRCLC